MFCSGNIVQAYCLLEKQVRRTVTIASAIIFLGILWAVVPFGWAEAPRTDKPVSVAVVTPPEPVAITEAGRLREAGIECAMGGDFDKALERFRQAGKVAPDDALTLRAKAWLEAYRTERNAETSERLKDRAAAVRRVTQCMLAQKYSHTLKKSKLDEKIRTHLEAAIVAHNTIPDSEAVGLANADELVDLKTKADKALADAMDAVAKAVAVLKDDHTPYAVAFRAAAERATGVMKDRRTMWKSLAGKTPAQRHQAAKAVRDSGDQLAGMLGEVESMVVEKPWRHAIMYARLARELTADKDTIKKEAWFQDLIADAGARGRNAISNAEWYDALSAYAGLKDLLPDNVGHKESAKVVQRHVRVLRLYGEDDASEGEADPAAETGGRTWKEFVANVDKDMIEKVITRMGRYYVKAIDYRKVIRGGLTSIKVLVETPQASKTFPKLKDDTLRKAMLKVIAGELEAVDKRDRLDQLDLSLALSNILNASDRSVKIPVDVLSVEFADGFLNELDRFSSMIWPYEVEDFNKQTMGRFYGIGVQITKVPKGPLKVVTPLIDSPAMKAGISTGDSIVAVVQGDKTTKTAGLTIDACVKMITGKENTTVTLRIKRSGRDDLFDVPVTRAKISVHTVSGWRRLSDGRWDYMLDDEAKIGYVRLKQFTDTTTTDMVAALKGLRARGCKSVILDLRANPGGLLREAGSVADQFLTGGRIVSTRGRQGILHARPINASRPGAFTDGNLVVLISQHSASAAEIVSGALRELKRGLIVGRRTYGKGSVQNVIPIPEHDAFLKLTTARYYVGNDEKLVHRENGASEWGVDPHVGVLVTPRQARLHYALQRKTEVIRNVAEDESSRKQAAKELGEDLADQYQADGQLRAGVVLLKLMQLKDAKAPA